MKTKLNLIFLGGLLLLGQAAMAQSTAPQTYTVTAQVPNVTGVGITVNSVDVSSGTFTPQASNTLTYGTLLLSGKTYLAPNFYTFDVANFGSGSPNTTITYGTETSPSGALTSLGKNSLITFDKEVFTSSSSKPTESSISGPFVLLTAGAGSGKNIPSSSTTGGWLRMYMGLCTGNASTDPTGCKAFTTSDVSGAYQGQLTITALTS